MANVETKLDLAKEEDGVACIKACKNYREYCACVDAVKKANKNGYPSWWYKSIVLAGLVVSAKQPETPPEGTKCYGCHMFTATMYTRRGNAVCKDCMRMDFAAFL